MVANFCSKCNFTNYPNCVLQKIIKNITFEELLNNKLKYEQYLVCPFNAQEIQNNRLELNNKCNGCNLCKLLCDNYKEQYFKIDDKLKEILFSDFNRIQMILKKWNSELKVASEVLFNGNFRSKRVDLVVINHSDVFLIKILKDTNKFDYYNRSLEAIKKEYSLSYKDLNFKPIFISYDRYIDSDLDSIVDFDGFLNITRRI